MHIPVLLKEVIELLNLKEGDTVVDATLNRGGHSKEICKIIGKSGTLIGIDLDQKAISEAQENLKSEKCNKILRHNNFRDLDNHLKELDIKSVNAILLDLGFSSNQIEESKRGFSFQRIEPLLMTLNDNPKEDELTAEEIVNKWEEESIADIIYGYGEEKFSRRIAKQIIESREEKPIKTTQDLIEIIEQAVPLWYKRKKIHFATKTFQALRIAVNDEIKALEEVLPKAFNLLKDRGRVAVISFHSIEDRIVKRFFKKLKDTKSGIIITKKPIIPNKDEILKNPRSRSAKLRIFEKQNEN